LAPFGASLLSTKGRGNPTATIREFARDPAAFVRAGESSRGGNHPPERHNKNLDDVDAAACWEGLKEISTVLEKMFRKGHPVCHPTNLRWAWAEACAKIGVGKFEKEHRKYEGLKSEDLRRSAGFV
jgi:hypothetical protein